MSLLHSSNKKKKLAAETIRGKVDETLQKAQNKFLSFNNGLVICHVGEHSEDKNTNKYIFKEPMLVNGGQTVQAILDHGLDKTTKSLDKSKLSDVYVPVKFISVDNHSGLTVQVAEAANNQNPVSIEDLLSIDPRLKFIHKWLNENSKHRKVWLELQEGSTGSLQEAGLWNKTDYSYNGIERSMDKEEWISLAFAAAGSGYKQNMSKSVLWTEPVIDLAFVAGAKKRTFNK